MQYSKIATARLHKQEAGFLKQPMQNAFVKRQGFLNFYFCIFNLSGDFKDGFYYGLLQLHPNYPFSAPKLFFYTPNGRYDVNVAICTSFTNYHNQSWTAAWNVRSLIQGTISFMFSNEPSYGCRNDDAITRKKYAKQSLSWNMNNQKFVQLFGQAIKQDITDIIKKDIIIYDKKLIQELNLPNLLGQFHQIQLQSSNASSKVKYPEGHYNQQNNLQKPLLIQNKIVIQQIDLQQGKQVDRNQDQERRNKRKKALRVALAIFTVVTIAGFIYYLWLKPNSSSSSSTKQSPQTKNYIKIFFNYINENLIPNLKK